MLYENKYPECVGCTAANKDKCLMQHSRELLITCICVNCLIKPMCSKMCNERLDQFVNLTKKVQSRLMDLQEIKEERRRLYEIRNRKFA